MAVLQRAVLRACSRALPAGQASLAWVGPACATSPARSQAAAAWQPWQQQQTREYAGQEYLANRFPKGAFASSQTLGRAAGFRPPVMTSDTIFDPYTGVPEGISAGTLLTPAGLRYLWRRAKGSLQSAYALAMAHRHAKPFKMPVFKEQALRLYEEVNTQVARGDRRGLIQSCSPHVNATFKRQIKGREDAGWSRVEWALAGPHTTADLSVVQARAAMGDPKDPATGFVQFTVRYRTRQVFGAWSKAGRLLAGGAEPVEVEELWVLEHPFKKQDTNRWRLVGKLVPVPGTKAYTPAAPVITTDAPQVRQMPGKS